MKAWYLTNDEGRITTTTTDEQFSEGMNELDFPDDFNFSHQGDYLVQDGNLVYDGAQTKEEEETAAAAESAKKIFEETNAFFAPGGGKSKMEQDIQAAQTGANPQLMTFARMAIMPMAASMTDDEAISVSSLWPEWSSDSVTYAADAVVQYNAQLWRCEQAHTSQESWTPDAAPSLWSQIDIAGDGVDVWTQPTGAHNAYNTGDRVHYPGKDSPIYESLIDGNTWAPDAYPQGWQEVSK